MFSGIVEQTQIISKTIARQGVVEIHIVKPNDFNDLHIGDSIAVNGICLTLEAFDDQFMVFVLAAETLHVTGWKQESLPGMLVNLERSLALGDRIHGSLMTGHVDTLASVTHLNQKGENLLVELKVPNEYVRYMWKKGSVILNGVSLTINEVNQELGSIFVGLIPETLRRTNLSKLSHGDLVNLEVDFLTRGYWHYLESQNLPGTP